MNEQTISNPTPPAQAGTPSLREVVKDAVRHAMGEERYGKLRFLRQHWWRHYRPRYLERRAQIKRGERGRLEDLYLFLTNQCNARCKHCFYIEELGYVPGEMDLEDYRKLAPTLPPLRLLTLTGGEAVLHPQCREIVQVLARATRAERVTLISNGFKPEKLEQVCRELMDEGMPGVLEVLISLDGMKEIHNTIRGNKTAWDKANESLQRLGRLKTERPGEFDLGVITIITDKNWRELEALNDHLRATTVARHGFEFIRGTSFSVWNLPEEAASEFNPPGTGLPPREEWDNILAALRRINRRAGIANHAFHVTSEFTVEMLKTGRKIVDCVSAGQNVGVVYPTGEVAICEFTKPFGNLRDFGLDFQAAWDSAAANKMRELAGKCHCTHGCYLSKNIEYTPEGMRAMVTKL